VGVFSVRDVAPAVPQGSSLSPSRLAAVLALAVAIGTIAACTAQLADLGEPPETPPRPAAQPEYPPVHDMPAQRSTAPLTAEERQKLVDELTAARERQEAETKKSPPR
jgi:hypothetical protein